MSQRKMYRAFGFLVAANTEAILLLVGAISSSQWLDEHYPLSIGWLPINLLVALVIIVHSWTRIFRALVAKERPNGSKQDGSVS